MSMAKQHAIPRLPSRTAGFSKKPADRAVDFAIGIVILAIVAAMLYPLWFVVIASISDQRLVSSGDITLFPKNINVYGYTQIFDDKRIWSGYRNTILYSFLGTAVNLLVTLPAAFALSRKEFKPRRTILFLFTFTMFFSGGMIPNYILYKDLHLLNNMWVFILPIAVNVYNLIIARSFFEQSIPEELFEAGKIDGLSYISYFVRIVLPLSSAIIAVLGLYYFVGHWNDFFTGLVYVRESGKLPLQNILRYILLNTQISSGEDSVASTAASTQQFVDQIKYGVIIVSTLPLLVIYPFLQKYFNKGVMLGAVKG